jgi:hypothetical protein
VLQTFIEERLGIPALVRRDLERLSQLVEQQNARIDRAADDPGLRIDSIMLYIEDLDRCPPAVVLQVLQAIHLLLAFRCSAADGEPTDAAVVPLTITPHEVDLVRDLAPILHDTPRAVKRFVNLYLLLKAIGHARRLPADRTSSDAAALLLAVGSRSPTDADALVAASEDPIGDASVGDAGMAVPRRRQR